jgi:hypothetical protein
LVSWRAEQLPLEFGAEHPTCRVSLLRVVKGVLGYEKPYATDFREVLLFQHIFTIR